MGRGRKKKKFFTRDKKKKKKGGSACAHPKEPTERFPRSEKREIEN